MPINARILLIEDEAAIRDMLSFAFQDSSLQLHTAANAHIAQQLLAREAIDLILLDWMLPGESGMAFLRKIRMLSRHQNLPVIMLTAKADECSKIESFAGGADDYVVKPFSPKELMARIQAVLRRVNPGTTAELICGKLCLDLNAQQLYYEQRPIKTGPLEFKLLTHFMQHPNRVYSRSQLLDTIWGIDSYPDERTVDVSIRRLRKALKPCGQNSLIQTVRGSGYRFTCRA